MHFTTLFSDVIKVASAQKIGLKSILKSDLGNSISKNK